MQYKAVKSSNGAAIKLRNVAGIERRTSTVLTSAIAQYIAAQVALNEVNL